MSDVFRIELDRCGKGGIRCYCCKPYTRDGGKREWTRRARARLKRVDRRIFAEVA